MAITTTTITISAQRVRMELSHLTSYLGGKREQTPEGYDRILLTDFDDPLVEMLVRDAAIRVASWLPRGLERWRYASGSVEFDFSGVADSSRLEILLLTMVSHEVLRRWIRLTGADYPEMWEEDPCQEMLRHIDTLVKADPTGKIARSRRMMPFP